MKVSPYTGLWIFSAILLCFAVIQIQALEEIDPHVPEVICEVRLTDGSRVRGDLQLDNLDVVTTFGEVSLKIQLLEFIRLRANRESYTFKLKNGDQITGAPKQEEFRIKSIIGELKIGLEMVDAIEWKPADSGNEAPVEAAPNDSERPPFISVPDARE